MLETLWDKQSIFLTTDTGQEEAVQKEGEGVKGGRLK
jgi:hypothetical protein